MDQLPNCYFEIRELIARCPNNEVWGDLLRGAVKAYDAWDYQRLGQIGPAPYGSTHPESVPTWADFVDTPQDLISSTGPRRRNR